MSADTESFNKELYDLLKVRGYDPVSKMWNAAGSKFNPGAAIQKADVFEFRFIKDGKDYGKVWASIVQGNVIIYYDDEQSDSPAGKTPGIEYDDSWLGFLTHVKNWAQGKQLSFELASKSRLGDDLKQREYYKMKEKLGEGYYPMGKKASYNDAVPNVKIVIQHSRAIEEGEQRYRSVAKIFLENVDGERFLAPTTRPGIARVYARHIAEGGVPNDERWGHIKSICEEYNKMAGFVRATRGKQFNESAQALINEGANHYKKLRETLSRMTGHRGYQTYFESWTPSLMEDALDESINELFVQENIDPRIENAMPILSRLKKPTVEMAEVSSLAEWADDIINEKLELDEISKNLAQKYISKASDQAGDLRFQAGMLHNQAMLDYNPYDRKNFKWLSPDEQDEYNKHINKAEKREKYTALARAKKNKSGETAPNYTPHAKAKIKATDSKVDEKLELDEISKNLAQRYINKASQSVDDSRTQANMINYRPFGGKPDPEEWREYNKLNTAADKREKQISLARAKKNKSGETAPNYTPHAKAKIKATDSKVDEKLELDEISKNLAQKYISKASKSADDLRLQQGMLHYNPWDIEDFELTPDEQDEYKNSKDKEEKREKMIALARAKKNKSGETTTHYTPYAKAKIKATDNKVSTDDLDETSDQYKIDYLKKASGGEPHPNPIKGMMGKKYPNSVPDLANKVKDAFTNKVASNVTGRRWSNDQQADLEKAIGKHWRRNKTMSKVANRMGFPTHNDDVSEGDSQHKVGDKVNWHDSEFDKNMTGTITTVSSGRRDGVKYASVKATGTHGSDFKVPHSKLKKVEEDLDANQKRAGQLGPTERVKNNNIGKLIGANESTEIDPELARIIEMTRFKR